MMLIRSVSRNSLVLGVFALATAGMLSVIYHQTAERIAAQEKIAAQKALLEIVPTERHDNDMLTTQWKLPEEVRKSLNLDSNDVIYVALKNDKPVAIIAPAIAPDGYSGEIKILTGINFDGSISGVRVVQHKETPGLGDKVDTNKSDWIFGFNEKSLGNPHENLWAVKKDGGEFDQFTGATITPRAVVAQVKNTLLMFENYKDVIFEHNHILESDTNNE